MSLPIRGAYPPEWRELARRTKDEAGWRCVRCHHPFTERGRSCPCDEGCDQSRGAHRAADPQPYRGTNYGVHHLDGDKGNGRWWNLLALCNHCHLSVQARVDPATPYLWEHSAWFRVYAAGFYAHYCGGEAITRDEAERDTDRYLAMGQPWLQESA